MTRNGAVSRRTTGAAPARRRTTSVVAAALAGLLLVACAGPTRGGAAAAGSTSARPRQLTVLAAASLTGTFTTLARRFERAHPGVRVRLSFGGSSALAQQVVAGVPADVFAAASPATMGVVVKAGEASAPVVFARNELEVAVPADNPANVRGLADLARHGVKVALCAPQVPCGATAAAALREARLTVRPVTLEQDVKAVVTKVGMGEVDAGLVYRTDVRAAGASVKGIALPPTVKAVTDYPIAVLRGSPDAPLAGEFVGLVTGPAGRQVLRAAGFTLP